MSCSIIGRKRRSRRFQTLERRRLLAVDATPDFIFPPDAGVIDLTSWNADPALNADPAPGNNDTAALQAALDSLIPAPGEPNDAPSNINRILYLPAGEYLIDQQLTVPIRTSNRASVGAIIQGQNRDSVTIKLADDVGLTGSVLRYQVFTADAFRNAVRDLTIDIGSGNPEATGLTFVGNNQATVSNVHIVSSDPDHAGSVGLELGTGANGPLLVENVSVDGFDIGIRTAFQDASQAFERIELTNQQVYGWVNEGDQNVFARHVTSVNEVPAIWNHPNGTILENAVFTLVDSELRGIGNAVNQTAIRTEDRFYARGVTTPGYDQAIVRVELNQTLQGNFRVEQPDLDEYWTAGSTSASGGTHELFDGSPDTLLQLPIADAPAIPLDTDLTRWASPTDFVTTNRDGTPSGVADDPYDDSLAIQAAIDSGASTIYFPFGQYFVDQVVQVGGNVERVHGMESTIASTTGDGAFRIEQTTAEGIVYERISSGFAGQGVRIEHASDTVLVGRNLQGFDYRPVATAPGDLFLYDVVQNHLTFRNQNVWARQLNVEGQADVNDPLLPDQKILNDNANLWVLGLKIEFQGTIVRNINGGNADLLGVYRNNTNFSDEDNPAFVTVDANTSVANFDAATAASGAYATWVSETRDGETRTSSRFGGPLGHVYTGFDNDALWNQRREVIVDNLDGGLTLQGDWTSTNSFPGGFLDENALFSRQADASATFSADLPVSGQYEVYTRWMSNWGGQNHSNHGRNVPITVTHADGTDTQTFNQDTGGNRWVSLGQYDFAAGDADRVTIASDNSGRAVIADAVRFVLIEPDQPLPPSPSFPIVAGTDVYETDIYAGGTYVFDGAENVLVNDIESGGVSLSVIDFETPRGGVANITVDGVLTYTPYSYFTGWDELTYTVTNGQVQSTGTVQLLVQNSVDGDGNRLRPATAAEMREAEAALIDDVRVVEFDGNGRASRLLSDGLLGDGLLGDGLATDGPSIGVGGSPGHTRGPDTHFVGPWDGTVTLDLGGRYRLDTTRIWNYNQQDFEPFFSRRTFTGATAVEVSVDTDADGNGLADDFVLAETLPLGEATARNDYSGEVFDLSGVEARFVRLRLIGNYADDPAFAESALSEIQFRGDLIEPAEVVTIANMLVGSTSSQVSNDRPGTRTIGRGFNPADNFHDAGRSNNWQSAADDPAPEIVYDLNDEYDLGSMRIWNVNYAPDLDRGAATINVSTSLDNVSFTPLKTIVLDRGTGAFVDHGQTFDLSNRRGRYVKLDIITTHGSTDGAGIAEVRFAGRAVVATDPEVAAVSASADSDIGDTARFLIDGSGLTDDGLEQLDRSNTQYLSQNGSLTPTIDFELAEATELTKLHVYNFTSAGQTGFRFNQGIATARVLTSVDGVELVDRGVVSFRRGFVTSQFEAINLATPAVAKFVRLQVLANHGDPQRTGFGEVRFFGTPADIVAPMVQSIVIGDGTSQRSRVEDLTVTFDEVVSIDPADVQVVNLDNGQIVATTLTTEVIDDRTLVTVALDNPGLNNGSLANGNYRLTISDAVTDAAGNRLDGDGDGLSGGTATDEFFRLYGDSNGDRVVNLVDLFSFRNAYGRSGEEAFMFDDNADGVINLVDLLAFREGYGRRV